MDAMIHAGFDSLLFGFLFLLIGLVELMILQGFVFPALRWRHEEAKLTGTHGRDPALIMHLLRFQSLALMPVVGFLFGSSVLTVFG
jgi:hypothetical protein